MLMACMTRVISKMVRTSSCRPQSRTSPPAARACFMAAMRVPIPELSIYATSSRSMRRRDWPLSSSPVSALRTSGTAAMSRSPRGTTTATPLDCVTSMFMCVPCWIGSRPGAAGSGGGPMARTVLDHGPPGAVLAGHVDGKAVRDRLHEKDAVAASGQRLEIGSIVLLGIERLAEVLHLDDQGLVRRAHGDLDGLAALALVGVLDGVGAQLAHREEQVGLLLLGHAVANQFLAQPLSQAEEVLGLARHGKGAAGGIRSHRRVLTSGDERLRSRRTWSNPP